MLELLVTSHGSSESWGFKQGTGCSRGLRAVNVPDGAGQSPSREEVKKQGGKKRKKKGEEQIFFFSVNESTADVSGRISMTEIAR